MKNLIHDWPKVILHSDNSNPYKATTVIYLEMKRKTGEKTSTSRGGGAYPLPHPNLVNMNQNGYRSGEI